MEFDLQGLKSRIFVTVSTHLLSQRQKAANEDGFCSYRIVKDDKTLMCAIGCLIDNTDYNKKMENSTVLVLFTGRSPVGHDDGYTVVPFTSGLLREVQEAPQCYQAELWDFLCRLQQIHDLTKVASWEKELHDFAEKYL